MRARAAKIDVTNVENGVIRQVLPWKESFET